MGLNSLFGGSKGTPNPFAIPDLNYLRQGGKTYADYYNAPGGGSGAFNSYLGSINAPSSVDQVRKGVNSDYMNSLLAGVKQDTTGAADSYTADLAKRGLVGPGQSSDIYSSGLGNVYATGAKNAGDIRSQFSLQELQNQKEKEQAAQQAYGQQYLTLAQGAGQTASMQNQRDLDYAHLMAQLYQGGVANQTATRKPGFLEEFGSNLFSSAGNSLGSRLGG